MKKKNKIKILAFTLLFAVMTAVLLSGCQAQTAVIVFESNGGSYISPIETEIGSQFGNYKVPKKEGYLFQGWFLDKECTLSAVGTKVKGDTVLYAKWYAQEITVTLDSGEAALGTVEMKSRAGDTFILPAEVEQFSYLGYRLKKWSYDKLGSFTYEKGEGVKLSKDTVFYAMWELNDCRVVFENCELAPITLPAFSILVKPEEPKRKGYVFGGWYEDETFQTPFEFGREILKDTVIYCKWDALFTFDYLDGMVAVTGLSEIGKEYVLQNNGVLLIPDVYQNQSVLKIADNAFSGQDKITSVSLPDTILEIGAYAFYNCRKLNSVSGEDNNRFPLQLKWIGASAFYNTALFEVVLASEVVNIGYEAFASCINLQSVTLSEKLQNLGTLAFSRSPVARFEVGKGNQFFSTVDGSLYNKEATSLVLYAVGKLQTSFTLPASVKSIEAYAFYGATKLTSITLSQELESIGMFALSDCTSLETIVIQNEQTVCSAQEGALSGCAALKKIIVKEQLLQGYLENDFWKTYSAMIGIE